MTKNGIAERFLSPDWLNYHMHPLSGQHYNQCDKATNKDQAREKEKREGEREEKKRFGSMVLRDHTNDSRNPKRLKLGLQLPTGTVFILYRYSRMFLDE